MAHNCEKTATRQRRISTFRGIEKREKFFTKYRVDYEEKAFYDILKGCIFLVEDLSFLD